MKTITDPDILSTILQDESGMKGRATGLIRPDSAEQIAQLVKECASNRTPLLPIGCQTATTGAAVPQDDLVVSLTGMTGVVDIDKSRMLAEVLPGTITWDLKQAIADEGLYYPPDPTSEKECTIGGNVASNASGARSFRWGMTSRWIEGLEVVTGRGETHRFFRGHVDKNTAGYGPFHDPASLFIGSEGTLGFVTRIWVRLIPEPGPCFAFLVFFPTLDDVLEAAVGYRSGALRPAPRCCEFFDGEALKLLSTHPKAPAVPANAGAALYLEFDAGGRDLAQVISEDLSALTAHNALLDDTMVGETLGERQLIRELRHHIPETVNSLAAQHHKTGGLKVSTEFCVPPEHILEMMDFVATTADDHGPDLLVRYGHIGNGHPHIFTRGRNPDEVAALKQLAAVWCRKAVSLGGTVSGEHGIGKTRTYLLPIQYPPHIIDAMKAVKRVFDPADIFARGNIFPT